jgi:hypothetical protein
MAQATTIDFSLSIEAFEQGALQIASADFDPVLGIFNVRMFFNYGHMGRYFLSAADDQLVKEALGYALVELSLPMEIAKCFIHRREINAVEVMFSVSLEEVKDVRLARDENLIEGDDYQSLSPLSVQVGVTGIIKLESDRCRILKQALSCLPSRYHWLSLDTGYYGVLVETDAGLMLDLEEFDYDSFIYYLELDNTVIDEVTSLLLMSKMRLWL